MTQTIADIKKQMTERFVTDQVVIATYNLTPGKSFAEEFSAVSIESILFDVFAFCVWTLQKLFGQHRAEIAAALLAMKAHTARWYATKALAFQFGAQLVADDDMYDNNANTAAQVAVQKVIKYAAAVEVPKGLRVKVATESMGDLTPLTPAQLAAFTTYMNRIKDAGVKVYCESKPADLLLLNLVVYYDPLILDATGRRLDGTANTPVQKAIGGFLKDGMPFNGAFVRTKLEDALQGVPGVVFPQILSVQARYGSLPWQPVAAEYFPDSGWLRILPANLTLQFLPHEPV